MTDKPAADWAMLSTRQVHDGRIVNLAIDTVRYPDGSVGELEFIRHSGAAAVVPVVGSADDPDAVILLIRQFRYASGGYLYEVPAGRPDQVGEAWELCAARELEEETGFVAGKLTLLTSIFTTPGFTDERIHLFLATDLTPGTLARDHDEFIELINIPMSKALDLIRTGEISDGKTICSLLYAARFAFGTAPSED